MGRSGREGRRVAVVGSMCAVVLAGGVAAAIAGPDDDGTGPGRHEATLQQVTTTTATRRTTTTATTSTSTSTTTSTTAITSTTPAPAPPTPRTATVRDGDVELTVRADAVEVDAGERLWLDVVVRNVGDETFAWQSGGCGVLAAAWLAPVGGDRPATDREVGWDGDPTTLRAWVEGHNLLTVERPAGPPGWRMHACPSDFGLTEVPPGTTVEQRTSLEVRLRPGDLPVDGRYVLVVSFQPWPPRTDPTGPYQTEPSRAPVVVSLPVRVTDHPARVDAAAALDAFAAQPSLAAWVEDTRPTGREDLVQSYRTGLGWWRGAWELWITPEWAHQRELRLRYDPVTARVVDVRQVHHGVPAEDEPDGERPDNPHLPPDDVYASEEPAAP